MFFSSPIVEMPKITTPTPQIAAQANLSPQGQALMTPGMSPAAGLNSLEKNKLGLDSVHFLAHGLPEKDGVCWACQSARLVGPKLSGPELDSLRLTEGWLKAPSADLRASLEASLGKLDFTGPGGWAGQAALWMKIPGMPAAPPVPGLPVVALTAAAVIGAILLAAGLRIGSPMPSVATPRLAFQNLSLPQLEAMLKLPAVPQMQLPAIDQPKMMKMLLPFLDLGKGVGRGSLVCV